MLLSSWWDDGPEDGHDYHRNRTDNFLRSELALTDEQLTAFRNLQAGHRSNMRELGRGMRQLNQRLHQAIIDGRVEEEVVISEEMDSIHFLMRSGTSEYIRSLSRLCTDEQRPKLLEVLNEIPDHHGHRGRGSDRRRHSKHRQ